MTIARREGSRIHVPCIMGELTILHEADNGVLVVREGRRKHWQKGRPDLPVTLRLMKLVDGTPEHYQKMLFNSAHLPHYPLVLLDLGESSIPGRAWREGRDRMISRANNFEVVNA